MAKLHLNNGTVPLMFAAHSVYSPRTDHTVTRTFVLRSDGAVLVKDDLEGVHNTRGTYRLVARCGWAPGRFRQVLENSGYRVTFAAAHPTPL